MGLELAESDIDDGYWCEVPVSNVLITADAHEEAN